MVIGDLENVLLQLTNSQDMERFFSINAHEEYAKRGPTCCDGLKYAKAISSYCPFMVLSPTISLNIKIITYVYKTNLPSPPALHVFDSSKLVPNSLTVILNSKFGSVQIYVHV